MFHEFEGAEMGSIATFYYGFLIKGEIFLTFCAQRALRTGTDL